MQMTKKQVKELRDEALALLEDWADGRGISVSYQGGSFSGTNAVLKFEFALIDAAGNVLSREVEDWKLYAPLYDLPEDGIGMIFVTGTGEFEITGWKAANKKYPVIAKSLSNGKQYKMTAEQVKFGLAMKAAEQSR